MIYTKFYELGDFDMREILRYAGSKEVGAVTELARSCIAEAVPMCRGSVCWCEVDVGISCGEVDLSFAKTDSRALAKNLGGCRRAVIFGATVGLEADRLIKRYSRLDTARAVMLQAIGAERIEALCDAFCADIEGNVAERGLFTRPRFSPGYGDLPLEIQRDFVRVLDCRRKIGVTLNESLLMSPSKSVTAIIGLSDKPCGVTSGDCGYCGKRDCAYRKEEK